MIGIKILLFSVRYGVIAASFSPRFFAPLRSTPSVKIAALISPVYSANKFTPAANPAAQVAAPFIKSLLFTFAPFLVLPIAWLNLNLQTKRRRRAQICSKSRKFKFDSAKRGPKKPHLDSNFI